MEAEGFGRNLPSTCKCRLYHGLETEKIFAALVIASLSGQPSKHRSRGGARGARPAAALRDLVRRANDRPGKRPRVGIEALEHRQAERELADVQRSIEANPPGQELRGLLEKKQD